MEENHKQNDKNEMMIPAFEIMVNFQTNGFNSFRDKRSCLLHTEKMHNKNLVQLRLTEKIDQRRMYITTVDSESFKNIKRDQSLHVSFAGFIENLTKMLQEVLANNLHLHLIQTQGSAVNTLNENMTNSEEYELHFVETRIFKNIIHLILPSQLAPLNIVLFYMNGALEALRKKMLMFERQAQQYEDQNEIHSRQVEHLTDKIGQMQDNHKENLNKLQELHANEIKQLQDDLRKSAQLRHDDNERFRNNISALQEKLENSEAEKAYMKADRMEDQKRVDILNEELLAAKTNGALAREQYEKVNMELTSLKISERKNELQLNEARKHISEQQNKIKNYEKVKADLKADLEAERNISQSKRKALEYATEEISKANQIIITQSQELFKLKRTLGWRTEVALKQEVAVTEKDTLINIYEEEMKALRQIVSDLKVEVPKELDSLRKFSKALEEKYSLQIKDLKEKCSTGERSHRTRSKSSISQRRQ